MRRLGEAEEISAVSIYEHIKNLGFGQNMALLPKYLLYSIK